MMTFGVLVRKRGAIGVFDWRSVKAPNADSAMQQAHELGYEVNRVDTSILVVGVRVEASTFPPLKG